MKLKFIKPQEIDKKIKATIHDSGKLGFSSEAATKLNLAENKGMLIAINEDDERDKSLYVKLQKQVDNNSFGVNKARKYFYANTKNFFDNYGIEYKTKKIMYDIIEFDYEGELIFKFLKREVSKKKQTG